MAGLLPPVVATVLADAGGFSAKMGEVRGEMAATTSSGSAAFTGLAGVGKVALLGLAAGAIGGGLAALKMGGDFQSGMTTLVTGAGESQSNMKMVGDGILAMAGQVGESTKQLTDGMFMIESAGFHGADGLKVLKAAAEGAKVGNADLATVSDGLTSALNAYRLPASQANAVTSELVATVASGKMHMQDLTGVLGAVLPVAAALHVPFEQVSGAMATMTSQGTPAATSAQSLRFLMAALVGPTKAAAGELKGMGLSASEAAGFTADTAKGIKALGLNTSAVSATLAGPGGLPAAMKQITDALVKQFPLYQTNKAQAAAYEAALRGATGGTRGLTAALELSGPHADTFAANVKTISGAAKNAGTDVQGWSLVQKDFNQQVSEVVEGGKAWVTQIGTQLIPYATTAMHIVAEFTGWLKEHKNAALALGIAIGGPLVLAMAAYVAHLLISIVQSAIWMVKTTADIAVTSAKWVAHTAVFLAQQAIRLASWVAAHAVMVAKAVATGVAAAAVWVAHTAVFLAQQAIRLVSWLATNAIFVATAVATGIAATAAFLLPLLPFILIGLAVALLVALIVTHWQQITDFTKQLADNIWNFIKGAFDNVMKAIGDVVNWVKSNWPLLLGILTGPVGLAVALIATHFSQIKQFASNVINDVTGFFGQLPGRVMGAVGGLVNSFLGLGGAIINGLIRGIQGAWHMVTDTLGNLAKSLPGPLQAVLGIHSPSTVFAEQIGLPIAQGIAQGISSGAGAAQGALGGLVGGLSGSASVGLSMSASGSASGAAAGGFSSGNDREVITLLQRLVMAVEAPQSGPTTGVEALVYQLIQKVEGSRMRGVRAAGI